VVQAVQRNLVLAIAPVIVLVVAAAVIATVREPTYSSDAQLNVGGVNLSTQSIPGYSVAVSALAVAYARSIQAVPIVNSISRRTGLSRRQVIQSMTATPVEQTPVVRIQAEASSSQQASRIANAAADALVKYAASLNESNPDTPRLLRQYIAHSEEIRIATKALQRGEKGAATRLDLANLQQRTDVFLYQASVAGDASTSLVRKLAPASIPESDRTSVFEQLLLAAVVAGTLIGVGLALARAHSQSRRRLDPL
jgi:capsular polysaccharide biosynthesis protein